MLSPIEIFCCYAHEDKTLLQRLKSHLKLLERQGLITIWSDVDINAGVEWEREITAHLNSSQIVLLLVSADFMASDYCYSKEMQYAMQRHEQKEARVIPILLRPTYWKGAPFAKLEFLPTKAKPVIDDSWSEDKALVDVAEQISNVVGELRLQRALSEAKLLVAEQQYKAALLMYDGVITIEPKHVLALRGKGETLLKLARYEESLKALELAIQADPKVGDAQFYRSKAEALVGLHDTEGTQWVVEMVCTEENNEIRAPLLEAIFHTYERFGEHDKASEVASLLENHPHPNSKPSDKILLRGKPEETHPLPTARVSNRTHGTSLQKIPLKYTTAPPIEIYTAYAQNDERYFQKIKGQLDMLQRQGWPITHHASEIIHSRAWQRSDHLETANLILLLVSTAFLNSDFCYCSRLQQAIEMRSMDKRCCFMPIILRPLNPLLLENTPFGKVDFLPTNGKALSAWRDSRQAYDNIVGYLLERIQEMKYYL